MTTIKFIFKNLWREGTIAAESSQHAQYPSENTQDDIKTLPWRTRHGTGSGNGRFVFDATNNKIDFDEGGAELTATITPGTYNAQTLVAEVKTRMDAAGGTYTPSYSESTGKFTLYRAAGNFTLRWLNGTNHATSAGGALGFITSADDTGAGTYTGDYVAIHTSEAVDANLGSALEFDFVALLNHNLTSAATATLQAADDAAFTTNLVSDSLTWNSGNIYKFLAAARTKQYSRMLVADPKNPAGFIQIGTIVLGKAITPNRNMNPYSEGTIDETELAYAPSGNLFVTQHRTKKMNWEFPFVGLNAAAATQIAEMKSHNGVSKALIFCTDTTAPNTYSFWAHFKELTPIERQHPDYYNWTASLEEVL